MLAYLVYPLILPGYPSVDIKDLEEQAREWKQGSSVNIMLVGKRGTGKTTLAQTFFANSEFGNTEDSSKSMTVHVTSRNGVQVRLGFWDAAGTKPQLEDVLKNIDLVIFTVKMDDTRYRPEDRELLEKASKSFGNNHHLWSKTMVALTFANRVRYVDSNSS